MEMFSQNEIILMIGVVSTLLVIITILTVLDVKDYLKNKDSDEEEYEFGEELQTNMVEEQEEVNEKLDTVEVLEVKDNDEEILIADVYDEPTVSIEPVKKEIVEPMIEEFEEPLMIEEVEESTPNTLVMEEEYQPEHASVDMKEELNKVLDTIPNEDNLVTSFEEEQERTAIISLDELMNKSNELYNQNEVVQYDDGNEPISIDEVISMFNKEEKSVPEVMQDIVEDNVSEKKEAYTHKETTPFISSVYGIEPTNNSLEFENTATYEKLSRVKKNEFMTKLREKYEDK